MNTMKEKLQNIIGKMIYFVLSNQEIPGSGETHLISFIKNISGL